jgi:ketosteroid isomerase-like protein
MAGATETETEALATYARFVALRDEIDLGKKPWSLLADFFTDDAAYVDPAWGRIEGREAIRHFFEESMTGLTGHGWSTPQNWVMADASRLVSQWDQILGSRDDGSLWRVAGLSILYYAGDGRFCYSHDMLNMTHVGETLKAMQWRPPAGFHVPPKRPNRDVSLPEAWAHLDPSRARRNG